MCESQEMQPIAADGQALVPTPEYTDIVDYIVRGTRRIWEEKNVGLIYTHYLHNATVHTSYGTTHDREGVIASTVQMQAAFPDRRVFVDDVVWTDSDEGGLYTSQRIISVGRNLGWSVYGPPTGKETCFRIIADRVVEANRICEEWLVRDELALIHGLGLDVNAALQRLIESGACPPYEPVTHGGVEHVAGQPTPEPTPPVPEGPFDVGSFVRRSTHDVWNWRMFGRVRDYYAPGFTSGSFNSPSPAVRNRCNSCKVGLRRLKSSRRRSASRWSLRLPVARREN